MRATLEQLKAMNDEQLIKHWHAWKFPFDAPTGGRVGFQCGCLIGHSQGGERGCEREEHKSFVAIVQREIGSNLKIATGDQLRPLLEQMYALRLFHDALYPQTVEAAEEKTIVESAPSLVAQG